MRTFRFFVFVGVISAHFYLSNEDDDDCEVKRRYKRSEKDRNPHITNKGNYNCDAMASCSELPPECVRCKWEQIYKNCTYGSKVNVTCSSEGRQNRCTKFEREVTCQFCYQTQPWEHECKVDLRKECSVTEAPRKYVVSNCTVNKDIFCIGERHFHKRVLCNWTSGYRWSTALGLSIVLGGFGADRFYLGRWQEGIGKLFSFGGLGVWTLIDIILIAIRYLGPADGSVYID